MRSTKYLLLLTFILFRQYMYGQLASAQIGKPVNALINISFGIGNDSTVTPGTPLPTNKTGFKYTTDPCPRQGYYTIARRVNISGCFNNTWHNLSSDHTYTDDNGNMMLVNDTTTPYNKILFVDTVKKLTCDNNMYEFTAAILNIDNPNYCSTGTARDPGFIFSVETTTGQVIHSYFSGRIDPGDSFLRNEYGVSVRGFDFAMPPNITSYVVKIIDSATGNGNCGLAFAVDDIKLLSIGADISIKLPGLSQDYIKTSTCFQDGKTVTLNGTLSAGYADPSLRWQRSIDSGVNWTDIPGATQLDYTTPPLNQPGIFLYRLRGSETSNISNQYCGSASNAIKVQVDGVPVNYTVSNNSPVCTDSNLVFILAGGTSYVTTGPNGFYDDSPFPHIYYPKLSDSGEYHVQVVSEGGCKTTDSTHAIIIGPPVTQVSTDTAICYGKTVQLHSDGGTSYSWVPAYRLSNANIANPFASPLQTTTYTVKITDNTGCSASTHVTVSLLDSVLKAAITGPSIVCPNDYTVFRDTSTGKIKSWFWYFGNGQTSALQNPGVQQYPAISEETRYSVQLMVTDNAGCADTALQLIRSEYNCYIAVPSAFTPNGDNLNDYLYPLNAYKATNLLFRVYNRNGQLVFETKDWTNKWDGSVNGILQPGGTYIWVLNYIDDKGKKIFIKGTSVLIR